jgi:hypothetical protein
MSIFARVFDPPPLRTSRIRVVALVYSMILVTLALAQLYSFTEMLVIVQGYWQQSNEVGAYVLATGIVISEIFALPFLLRMRASHLARWVSMALGWLAAAIWICVSVGLMLTAPDVPNIGLLGDVIAIAPGIPALTLSLLFGVLAAWASWGMWPSGKTRK